LFLTENGLRSQVMWIPVRMVFHGQPTTGVPDLGLIANYCLGHHVLHHGTHLVHVDAS
jgi:hypothetical protein